MNNVVLLIAIPLLFVFGLPLVGIFTNKLNKILSLMLMIFNCVFAGELFWRLQGVDQIVVIGGFQPPFGINFYLSNLSLLGVGLVWCLGGVVLINIFRYKQELSVYFINLFVLFFIGITGIILTGDIFNMFIFLEITSIALFALLANNSSAVGAKGSFIYLIWSSISTAFMLLGIGLIYLFLGTLNLAEIAYQFHLLSPFVAVLIIALVLGAILLKLKIFPLNKWVPDLFTGASTIILPLLSGIIPLAAVYMFVRMGYQIFNIFNPAYLVFGIGFNKVLIILGILTMLMGEISALVQKNLKRMLGYSSMGQAGFLLIALSLGSKEALFGALFYLVPYVIAKTLLLLVSAHIITELKSAEINNLQGVAVENKFLGFGFILGSFGVLGLPLFGGFWGKFMIFQSLFSQLNLFYSIVILLIFVALIAEGTYFFRVISKMYQHSNITAVRLPQRPQLMITILLFASFIIYIGIQPSLWSTQINSIVTELSDQNRYIETVFPGVNK